MPRTRRTDRAHPTDLPLAALACAGPVAFTGAWWLLGNQEPGYSQRTGTISALAAHGSAVAAPMLAAFAVQGAAQLANAVLSGRRRLRPLSGALVVAGLGTWLAGATRLPAETTEADPSTVVQVAHLVAATAAFGGLHAAVLAGALERRLPRWLRVAAAGALAVAVPHTVWFVVALRSPDPSHLGYAEKAFTTVLIAWTATVALTLAYRGADARPPSRPAAQPG